MGEINQARLVVDEISIIGSRCGRLQPALDLLKKGALDIDSLISEEYPLARVSMRWSAPATREC